MSIVRAAPRGSMANPWRTHCEPMAYEADALAGAEVYGAKLDRVSAPSALCRRPSKADPLPYRAVVAAPISAFWVNSSVEM